jgi:hypothetical protein
VNLAVRASDLHAVSRHIMLTLSDIADNGTSTIPPSRDISTSQLARETGWCEKTISRRRRELEEDGWIILERPTAADRARHITIKYRLAVPVGAEAPAAALRGERESGRSEGTLVPSGQSDRGDPKSGREGTQSPVARGTRVPSIDKDDVPTDVPDFEKPPPAGADPAADRAARLAIAEDLEQRFHLRYGTSSAQRRGAVRDVIITAIADNCVPRLKCARALDILGARGRQITRDSLTAQLGAMTVTDPRPLVEPRPGEEEPAWARRGRYCTVPGHETTQLTPSGLCTNCAADSRAAAWSVPADHDDQPATPTLGALLLDHGGDHEIEMTRDEARVQQTRARAYVTRLPDPDRWRQLATERLLARYPDAPGYAPNADAVELVAAELHRRSLTTVD